MSSQCSEYYYFDGQIYYVSPEAGSYTWAADSEEFYAEFCYAAPLTLDMGKGEKADGSTVYTATLNGDDYRDTLLAINPRFEELRVESSAFTAFTYTATVKDGGLTSYG